MLIYEREGNSPVPSDAQLSRQVWGLLGAGRFDDASELISASLLAEQDQKSLLAGVLGFAFEREAAFQLVAAIRGYHIAMMLGPDDPATIRQKIATLSALAIIDLIDSGKIPDAHTCVPGLCVDIDDLQRATLVSAITAAAHERELASAFEATIALLQIAGVLGEDMPVVFDIAKRLSSVTAVHVATLASHDRTGRAAEVLNAFLASASEVGREAFRDALLACAHEKEQASEFRAALACFSLARRAGNSALVEERITGLTLYYASKLLEGGYLEQCEAVLQAEYDRLSGGMAEDGKLCLLALQADSADAERLTAEAAAQRQRQPGKAALLLQRADAIRPVTSTDSPSREGRLLILDTSFPSTLSSFRYDEITEYLRMIPRAEVLSSVWDMRKFIPDMRFLDVLNEFAAREPALASRIKSFHHLRSFSADLIYTVFLNNAVSLWLNNPHRGTSKLAFTLYPGGGFGLEDEASDARLRCLFDDAKLRRVITTQRATYEYLVSRNICDPSRISHIFGGLVAGCLRPQPQQPDQRSSDGPLDVCFVAQRYTIKGVEKGCDVFTDVARIFAGDAGVRFHYVGGWTPENVGLDPADNIIFHGVQPRSFFRDFYRRMHLMISANVSFYELDGRGSFDGFPTTVCVEAAAEGVGLLMTDSLGSNRHLDGRPIFIEGREFVKVSRDGGEIAAHIRHFRDDRDDLRSLSELGRAAMLREFDYVKQMSPRIKLLEAEIARG